MPTPRKRLGKGLGALLGEEATARGDHRTGVTEVPVARIRPNRYQPRISFDDESIADLAASIAQQGVLQPLIVTPHEDGDYELVSGERRWRAAQRAGLARVPVLVREVDARGLLEIALIENLQREDLDAIEEATGYRRLVEEFDLTQAELATRVGKSRPAVANALRLLDLPEAVLELIRDGRLSAGHGRALLGLDKPAAIADLAREAVRRELSVRQLERSVKRRNADGGEPGPVPARSTQLERQRLEEALQHALGTKVSIRLGKQGRGKIELAFYSAADLERLVERLKSTA